MDSFYASVEVRDDPTLAGLPVVVGGDADRRGVVSSASYEARKWGIHSAMPMATARKRCPELVVVSGHMGKYVTVSRALRRIFREFSPLVEPLSLDEAFLDLTGAERLLGSPREIGEAIRRRIREDLALTASVGLATSKFVAKLASDHRKPDGLTVVPPEDTVRFVQSLPLERLWGVGPATREALDRAGIRTIAALAEADARFLESRLGSSAGRLIALARGEDDRPVVPDAPAKSVSHEITFAVDQFDAEVLEGILLGLAERVARRARRAGVWGRTVTLKLRRPDFTTFTRSRTLGTPTRDASEVFGAARDLFRGFAIRDVGVRLLGVGLTGLEGASQLELGLFGDAGHEVAPDEERRSHLHETEDAVVERFGSAALGRAKTLLGRPELVRKGKPDAEDQSPR
jgi:DNA polymerase-4